VRDSLNVIAIICLGLFSSAVVFESRIFMDLYWTNRAMSDYRHEQIEHWQPRYFAFKYDCWIDQGTTICFWKNEPGTRVDLKIFHCELSRQHVMDLSAGELTDAQACGKAR
jgi:hypothetical protein